MLPKSLKGWFALIAWIALFLWVLCRCNIDVELMHFDREYTRSEEWDAGWKFMFKFETIVADRVWTATNWPASPSGGYDWRFYSEPLLTPPPLQEIEDYSSLRHHKSTYGR